MAWTFYRELRRKVGARLRVSDLSLSIVNQAPKNETVWQVVVVARREGTATLRVWSARPGWSKRKPERHTVTIVNVPEDPGWIAER